MIDFIKSLKWYLIFGKIFGIVFFSLETTRSNTDYLYFIPYLFIYVFSITYRLMFQKFLYHNKNNLLAIVENLTDNFMILSQLLSLLYFYYHRNDFKTHIIQLNDHSIKSSNRRNHKARYIKRLSLAIVIIFVIVDVAINSYINFSFYCIFLTPIRTMIFEQSLILKIIDENKKQINELNRYLQNLKACIVRNNHYDILDYLKCKYSYYRKAIILTERTNRLCGIPLLFNMLNTLLITVSLLNYFQHNVRGSNKYDLKFFINYTWFIIIIIKLYDIINKWSSIIKTVSFVEVNLIKCENYFYYRLRILQRVRTIYGTNWENIIKSIVKRFI